MFDHQVIRNLLTNKTFDEAFEFLLEFADAMDAKDKEEEERIQEENEDASDEEEK
jgi:hypothetical protein